MLEGQAIYDSFSETAKSITPYTRYENPDDLLVAECIETTSTGFRKYAVR